jgi:hypothetical protein
MAYKYPSLRTTLPIAGYYARLDAGAAASDQFTIDGSQDGTLTNGATRSGSPLAYSLDGTNDFIDLGNVSVLGFAGSGKKFTVAAWVNFNSVTATQYLISKGRSSSFNSGWAIDFYQNAGTYYLDAATANGLSGSRTISRAAISVSISTWYHVCVTFDGSLTPANAFKFYLNGALLTKINDETSSTIIAPNTLSAKLGAGDLTASPGSPAFPFGGLLDDFVIYDITQDATNVGYLASQRGAIYAELATSQRRRTSQASIRSTF